MTAEPRPDGMSYQLYRMILKRKEAVLKAKLRQRDRGPGVQRPSREPPPPMAKLDPLYVAIMKVLYD